MSISKILSRSLQFVLMTVTLAAMSAGVAWAQSVTVKGTITDTNGDPVMGAGVMVKGTSKAVASDVDGKFTIEAPADGTLVLTAMGFKETEIPVNGRSVINAVMEEDAMQLDETIVVAYGVAKKSTYTGAAATVKADAIKDIPSTSFENALNGKVAGMQITQTSGQAGSAPSIRIRGIGSMNASNEPLYVIDGVPVISGSQGQMGDYIYTSNNVMNTLNPSDIENITVLKDAAASALYGSRAANGVVMITTKRGKMGKPTVSFKASVGITPSFATHNYEAAGIQEQVQMLYEVFHDYRTSAGRTDEYAREDAISRLNTKFNKHGYYFEAENDSRYANIRILGMTDGMENREGKYFDWEDALFRTAVYQTYDLSVSGGTENTNYYSSFSYTKDQGRAITNDYSRIAGRVNLNQKVGKHVEFATNVSLSHGTQSGFNDTRNTNTNYFMQTRNLLWGLYWPTNYKNGNPWTDRYGSLAQNHVYYNNEWDNSSKTMKISASETLTIHVLDGLDVKSIFSYDDTRVRDFLFYSAKHYSGENANGSVTEMFTGISKWVSSTTVNYAKEFGKHNLNILAGFEAEKNNTDYMRSAGTDLPPGLKTVAVAGVLDASGYSWGHAMASILSRAEYNYDQRYFASASYRRDGSSRLGPDNRWGNFWSVAGSWKINNEAFMRNIDWINNLRIRASYGVNGTLPTSNYGWRNLMSYGNKYMQQVGAGISSIGTSDLTWETSHTYNLALEFGLFNQRLYGTVEYFNRDSKDLLQNVPVSTIIGLSSMLRNIGSINNNGWELELGGDIIRSKEVTWDMSLTASFIDSKVKELYDGQDIIWSDPTGGDARAQFIYREGESTLALYGREWAGVEPSTGKNLWYLNNDTQSEMTLNGRAVTYDKNKADQVILADMNPKMYGGINTSVSWKGFSLGLNFIYKLGSKLFDAAEKDVDDDGYYWERIRSQRVWDNRWMTPGTITDIPRLSGEDLEDAMGTTSRHIHNGNFLRLKNLTLSYSLPKSVIGKVGLSNARVYFTGGNLLTWAAFKEVDPEVGSYGTRGWEMPFGKTYTFGVEFSF